ncbi:MAG TPA: DUF4173 domain-containing protein [Actinomycetota bacterium]|nr:DUF4173 domain-containing protein [Actinomycetota bacterium]
MTVAGAPTAIVNPYAAWTGTPHRGVTGAEAAVAVAAGVGLDLALRSGVAVTASVALMAGVVIALILSRRLVNPQSVALAAASLVTGSFLALRASAWLLPLDLLVSGALLMAACSYARGGSVVDVTVPRLVQRGIQAGLQGLLSPAYLASGLAAAGGGRRGIPAVLRGLALATPVVLVVGLLLASADTVFASFVRFDLATAVGKAIVVCVGAFGFGALLRLTAVRPPPDPAHGVARLGSIEWTILLGSLNLLLGAFAAARLVALSEGGRRVIESAGLTYAEYARSGFFQLLAATVLILVCLLGVRAVADTTGALRLRFHFLSLGVVALTLVAVASALHRLHLYERVFGATMPRLAAKAVCFWIGVVLIALAICITGNRRWFWFATAASGLVVLIALNVMNPEAYVVRRNVDHALQTGRFDGDYVGWLSDDAVPELVRALPRLKPEARVRVLEHVCWGRRYAPDGWWAENASAANAEDARTAACGGQRTAR